MLNIWNFKFKQLLDESMLTQQEKYDLSNIFACLSDSRKIEIIGNWPFYLNWILKIRNETEEKRKENIMNALNNIDNIVNDAILRKKDEEQRKQRESESKKEEQRTADIYNQFKKTNDLQNLIRKNNEQS